MPRRCMNLSFDPINKYYSVNRKSVAQSIGIVLNGIFIPGKVNKSSFVGLVAIV